ncbi:hypothetical protein E2C01_013363 [Portunus trituberculatus]|uniref:Uncharacterized protein n=1 Tax=Portunus trituberculatus TaxID=210409 RepID=A0A5B7DGF6_PORTR|nr:hypothetical protein [Portunus trituberculatus]
MHHTYDLGGVLPPARKPLPRVRKPNLHSDRGQDSNPCAWRPLGFQSTHGSIVPRRLSTYTMITLPSIGLTLTDTSRGEAEHTPLREVGRLKEGCVEQGVSRRCVVMQHSLGTSQQLPSASSCTARPRVSLARCCCATTTATREEHDGG